MWRVLRVLQFLQREVGRGDQRLAASVTAVNHAVNLFQPVFLSLIHIFKHKLYLAEMENALLKKWDEVERRDVSQK